MMDAELYRLGQDIFWTKILAGISVVLGGISLCIKSYLRKQGKETENTCKKPS